ncbi:MAG: hypothetical protein ACOYLF_13045, partial [Blastocatellia bacterium]
QINITPNHDHPKSRSPQITITPNHHLLIWYTSEALASEPLDSLTNFIKIDRSAKMTCAGARSDIPQAL